MHTLIAGTHGYVMLRGKRNCADIIKVADFKIQKLSLDIWLVSIWSYESLKQRTFSSWKQRFGRRESQKDEKYEKESTYWFEDGGANLMRYTGELMADNQQENKTVSHMASRNWISLETYFSLRIRGKRLYWLIPWFLPGETWRRESRQA